MKEPMELGELSTTVRRHQKAAPRDNHHLVRIEGQAPLSAKGLGFRV